MYRAKEYSKRWWLRRVMFFQLLFVAAMLVFGAVVMYLWNAILPDVLGLNSISYLQAIGILLLSKILFGGFWGHRCRYGRHEHLNNRLREKWMKLTPEEREKLRHELHHHPGAATEDEKE